ncbi:MAG: alpha/beta fold hydrolase [Planctomycetota bacterium]
MMLFRNRCGALLGAVIALVTLGLPLAVPAQEGPSRLALETGRDPKDGSRISRGTYSVFEDRESQSGRMLHLGVVILHARSSHPQPDPVFLLAGGPGVDAVSMADGNRDSWMRQERDLVFVSQRGTGGNHSLRFLLREDDGKLQGYLDPIFDEKACRAALLELEKKADLTKYSTPIAMDDLNEVREALGYEKINLSGGSYGSRAALIYLRRHPETVRCAIVMGIAPLKFKNPLYHAWSAQHGLERIFEEVEADPEYRRAFPNLRKKFDQLLARLEEQPARVTVSHPETGKPEEVTLTRAAFAEGLRTLMYYNRGNRQVPLLLQAAYDGDLAPFAEASLAINRNLRNIISFGMLLSVTAAEDVARLEEEEIVRLTEGTFLGDDRVRQQMAICAFWPKSDLPEGFGDPVRSDVPMLIISGTHDPVTPPMFGDEVAEHCKNALHLALPGTHGISHPALTKVMQEFLEEGSAGHLDLKPLKEVKLPRFELPDHR